ncbi:MAG: hypothetical protein Q9201_001322 [Fulgogasparrea decipioides]
MLSILRKARLKDKEMRILMLGLDNAGKTTIVKKLMNEDVNTVSPTLGFIIRTIDYEGCVIMRLMGASLLVLANKTDIEGSMSIDEIHKLLALDAIKTHNWTIMQCSAITGFNVQEGIKWVVEDAKQRLFLY